MSSRKLLWIIIGLGLLVWLGVGGIWLSRSRPKLAADIPVLSNYLASPTPSLNQELTFKTFTDSEYDFSFLYPEGLEVSSVDIKETSAAAQVLMKHYEIVDKKEEKREESSGVMEIKVWKGNFEAQRIMMQDLVGVLEEPDDFKVEDRPRYVDFTLVDGTKIPVLDALVGKMYYTEAYYPLEEGLYLSVEIEQAGVFADTDKMVTLLLSVNPNL